MIRVLELFPGSPPEPIQCYLRPALLFNHPKYEALSYCWAGSSKGQFIVCNEAILEITETLFIVLTRLQSDSHSRHLWVDAICINQADPEEKSYQVGLMGKIYQLAKFVVILLGEQADGANFCEAYYVISQYLKMIKRVSERKREWDMGSPLGIAC